MLCFVGAVLISYHSAHFPITVNNKRFEHERTIQLVIFFVQNVRGNGIFSDPGSSSQKEQKDACHLWGSFCVMLIAKNRKFRKIRKPAEVGVSSITNMRKYR